MIPWILIDTAKLPGGGELRLKRRGSEFTIMLDTIELMNSRRGGSEQALATRACAIMPVRPDPHVLIGGLGMGCTLRATLGVVGPEAKVTVAELAPAVIAWARGPVAEVFAGSLDDPRVSIREADVGALIRSAKSAYDAILLDVDNGPDNGLIRTANGALYDDAGLAAARAALRPGGVLGIWSIGPDKSFLRRLRRAGYDAQEIGIRAGGARHVIWIAKKL